MVEPKSLNKPFFSIVIPYYNTGEKFLSCLESVTKQSFKSFEIIVIDDCSDIKVHAFAKSVASEVIILRNETNLGPLMSRLEGVKISKGDYILFLDSDDYLLTDCLQTLYEIINSDYLLDIVHFKALVNGQKAQLSKDRVINNQLDIMTKLFVRHELNEMCFNCYRKDFLIQETPLPDSLTRNRTYGEDYLFNISLLPKADNIYFLEKELYYYNHINKRHTFNDYYWLFLIENYGYDTYKLYNFLPINVLNTYLFNSLLLLEKIIMLYLYKKTSERESINKIKKTNLYNAIVSYTTNNKISKTAFLLFSYFRFFRWCFLCKCVIKVLIKKYYLSVFGSNYEKC